MYPLVIRKFYPPSKYVILYKYNIELIDKITGKDHLKKQINKISNLCHIWIRKNF